MEYVIGPVLALLIGMKFTAYKTKPVTPAITHEELAERISLVDARIDSLQVTISDNNKAASEQTLKMLMPVAKSVSAINKQLGL